MLQVIGAGFGRTGTASTKAASFGTPYEDQSPAELVAAYEQHNAAVRAEVPEDRLLEHDVTQGWDPLCDFLDLPVPDAPMPRTNDRRAFRELFGLDGPPREVEEPYTQEQIEGHFRASVGDAAPPAG